MSMMTCEGRFNARQKRWKAAGVAWPRLRHHVWWLLHNVVAHPLLAYPTSFGLWLHDVTSQHLNRKAKFLASPWPEPIPDWGKWVFHNVILHAAIGLVPCTTTFTWHDQTAEEMGVEDWV